jgi:hypothetical protein
MDEKRLQNAREKRETSPWRGGWVGGAMGLLLIAGALLSVGSAPANPASRRSFTAAPAAAVSPGTFANADRDVFDMQLD